MARITQGRFYQVTEGSGLNSNKIGVAVNSARYSLAFIRSIDPGAYKPFDHKRETLMLGTDGKFFVMFKSRLVEVANE